MKYQFSLSSKDKENSGKSMAIGAFLLSCRKARLLKVTASADASFDWEPEHMKRYSEPMQMLLALQAA
ncbi:hypothetical protein Anapl_15127 [Anas platyrhynchos]|uniref:Uncharacterized protein n=1 Tax=Anas platyrhynchos TaxID=8839 RepID=R0JQK8_ANAPL|nr:hypothetical protein Anapl_15127 [Anas platyrhynchos]